MCETVDFCFSCLQLWGQQVDRWQRSDSEDPPHPYTSTDNKVSWRHWYIHVTCVSMCDTQVQRVWAMSHVALMSFVSSGQSPVMAGEEPTKERVRWQVLLRGKCLLSPSRALTVPPSPMTLNQVSSTVPTCPPTRDLLPNHTFITSTRL